MTPATRRIALLAFLATPGLAFAQAPQKAEKPPEKAEKPKAKPSIYDKTADSRIQVERATARARRDSKRILVMFGGDWCGWCHKLHALFKDDKAIAGLLGEEYILVMVDTKAPNAEPLLEECTGDLKDVGFPFLSVLDQSGKVVTRQKTDPLEEGDHHDPKKVLAFLEKWTVTKASTETVYNEALAKAKSEDKLVFLHFGAPWCGWCHKLEDFLMRPEIAAILGEDFVDVKIDEDRMTGGKALDARFRADAKGGIPWFAFVDSEGKVLTTSDGPNGNIGYPVQPDEIAHFMAMLRKVTRKIEPGQVDAIETALKEAAKPIMEQISRPRPSPANASK